MRDKKRKGKESYSSFLIVAKMNLTHMGKKIFFYLLGAQLILKVFKVTRESFCYCIKCALANEEHYTFHARIHGKHVLLDVGHAFTCQDDITGGSKNYRDVIFFLFPPSLTFFFPFVELPKNYRLYVVCISVFNSDLQSTGLKMTFSL